MSPLFIAALIGIAVTLLGWFGPWAWPAWPAFTAIRLIFGPAGFSDLPFAQKAITLVGLILINVSFWGLISWSLGRLLRLARK